MADTTKGNSLRIPYPLATLAVLLVVQVVAVAFMFGMLRSDVENLGDRLVRIERLLDDRQSVQR